MDSQIKLNNSLKPISIPKILLYFEYASQRIMRYFKMYPLDSFISVDHLTKIKCGTRIDLYEQTFKDILHLMNINLPPSL